MTEQSEPDDHTRRDEGDRHRGHRDRTEPDHGHGRRPDEHRPAGRGERESVDGAGGTERDHHHGDLDRHPERDDGDLADADQRDGAEEQRPGRAATAQYGGTEINQCRAGEDRREVGAPVREDERGEGDCDEARPPAQHPS